MSFVEQAPIFSIVTATFRSASTVARSIASLRAQSFDGWEHIVIDGASGDGTLAELQRLQPGFAKLVSEADRGVYDALNKGFALARGEVFGVLHADDMLADRDVLKDVANVFENPAVDVCYGDLEYVSREHPTKVVRHWRSGSYAAARLAWGWMPPHPTVFLRRRLFEALGGYDLSYRISADYDWLLRLLPRVQGRIAYLPRVLVRMSVGGISNRSLGNVLRKSLEDWRAIRRNRIGGLHTLVGKNLSKLPQFLRRGSS